MQKELTECRRRRNCTSREAPLRLCLLRCLIRSWGDQQAAPQGHGAEARDEEHQVPADCCQPLCHAFYVGVFLSMTLILAALLSAVATVRESRCLTVTAFFCFALAFCGMIPALCWRYMHNTEVENSILDVYDLVYEEVRRNGSSSKRHELTRIHEVFLCCGKHSPLGDTAAVERRMCRPGTAWAAGQDCLQEMHSFLKKHMSFVSTLLGITIGFTVYGMVLTSFLWFSIHFSNNLDRKGKYTLRGS
uniref:Tetraspanin 32 n=1 Tax=Coturnix japonica TaxID=93934 RepID=A0A8C2U8R6_COTJA